MSSVEARGAELRPEDLHWGHLRGISATSNANRDDDNQSVGSRASRGSYAGSTYSAATFYSFSTSNYSGFAASAEMARRAKRHYVNPIDLDPNYEYDVDWVQDDDAKTCMVCDADFNPILRRKHHCRACGRVVCASCSRARVFVTGLRGLQKACTDCVREAEKVRTCERICEDTDLSLTQGTEECHEEGGEKEDYMKQLSHQLSQGQAVAGEEGKGKGADRAMSAGGPNAALGSEYHRQEMEMAGGGGGGGGITATSTDQEEETGGAIDIRKGAADEKGANSEGAVAVGDMKGENKSGGRGIPKSKETKRRQSSSMAPVALAALAIGGVLVLNPKLLKNVMSAITKP